MRLRVLVSSLILLVIVTFVVVLCAKALVPAAPKLSFSLCAYSNSPSGVKFAILSLTNRDTCDLTFNGPPLVEFEGTDYLTAASSSAPPDSRLRKADSCILVVPVPVPQGRWRVRWNVTRHTFRESLGPRLRQVRWLGLDRSDTYNVASDLISQ